MKKVCVVTGGNRGIGLGIAKQMLSLGCSVYSLSRKEAEKVEGITHIVCDVSDLNSVKKAHRLILEKEGRVDYVVSNSGIRSFNKIDDPDFSEKFQQSIAVNLIGAANFINVFSEDVINTKGNIVVVGSHAGAYPQSKCACYSTSKGALEILSDVCMQDLRQKDVKVTYINLGTVKNREHEGQEESWKLLPEEVGAVVKSIITLPSNVLIKEIDVRPAKPPKMPMDSLEYHQFL